MKHLKIFSAEFSLNLPFSFPFGTTQKKTLEIYNYSTLLKYGSEYRKTKWPKIFPTTNGLINKQIFFGCRRVWLTATLIWNEHVFNKTVFILYHFGCPQLHISYICYVYEDTEYGIRNNSNNEKNYDIYIPKNNDHFE